MKRFLDKVKKYLFRKKNPCFFDDFTRISPVSTIFGLDRGTAIDRYYIEDFLRKNAFSITGDVLEVGDSRYTKLFGKELRKSDILLFSSESLQAESGLIGDLTKLETLPKECYDCFICTQTLNFIFDVEQAIHGASHLLKKNGSFLGTVSGIPPVSVFDYERWGDYWRFTDMSLKKLLNHYFSEVTITPYGNVLAAKCIMDGVSVEDLPDKTLLNAADFRYPVTLGFIAREKEKKVI